MKRNYPWKVQKFKINSLGRDFVAGDIHGEFEVLEKALEQLNFDYEVDRLFCVGDLIDRGPQSARVAEFLYYKWFNSIAGNHEWMLYNCHDDKKFSHSLWYPNGGGWWDGITQAARDNIVGSVQSMLYALITVQTPAKQFGLVHALSCPYYSWPEFCQKIGHDQVLQQWALWERDYQAYAYKTVDGIDLIFCGHTPMNEVHRFSNFINIDTGCGHRSSHWLSQPALTIVELSESLTFYQFPTAK